MLRIEIDVTAAAEPHGGPREAHREGEIIVYGPPGMKVHLDHHVGTCEVVTRDGGFKTGDKGYLDDYGSLVITGRIETQCPRYPPPPRMATVEELTKVQEESRDAFESAGVTLEELHRMDLARVTRFFRSSFPHVTPKDHFLELARRRPLEELRTEGFADLVGLVIADPFMGSEISWELRQRPRELRAMSLPRLVRFVMEVPCLWAAVVWELERRPRLADAEVGRSLALSYREGRVSADITAALLPLVGGDEAYGMAREMLLAGLEVYNASAAMLELDLDAACDDLFEILCDEATSLPVRRATANALSARQHPRIVPAVIDAVRSGRLGPFRGRDALMGQPISEAQLVTWLGENDGTIRALAFDLASRRLDKQLGEVMRQALRKGRYVVEPHDAGITSVFLASRAGSANS